MALSLDTPAVKAVAIARLAPLFLVSASTVGIEIALTRYFAVAKWSEYGYWVISIVLAGFALSGVVMAVARGWIVQRGRVLLGVLPPLLILTGAAGYHAVTTNPFNPLELQNQATLVPQLWFIAGYYAALLPFFFLAGLYISLSFVLNAGRIGRVYGYDLTGAGAGSLAALLLMTVVHPFRLVPCLLVPLALAALWPGWRRGAVVAASIAALGAAEAALLLDDRAAFNDFKAIYAPLHVEGARVVREIRSPRGLYTVLDDFTERLDTDVSNNAGLLGVPGPPATLGVYRDGNRVAALPKQGAATAAYAPATLGALPYRLLDHPRVLLAGTSGGFREAEARALGAREIVAAEPEPTLRALAGGAAVAASPLAVARRTRADGRPFDLIDVSSDFLDSSEANASAFAAQSIADDLAALAPDGLLSLPVSIREFPAYAVRLLATVREGLRLAGVADPAARVLVYRSAWNVRILVAARPLDPARIAAARAWCDERSFDVSYFPGIATATKGDIYNDLPAVSFDAGEVTSGDGPHDAIADEAPGVLAGETTASSGAFDLSPITWDRPSFYSVLRLSHLGTIMKRLELLPQAEIGALVNVAVLVQALVVALAVLAVPAFARVRAPGAGIVRPAIYFAALGLGFLFVEIHLIERASFYLADRTSGFALVLTSMLVFSGLGSMAAGRFDAAPAFGARLAVGVLAVWSAAMLAFAQPAILATLDWPWPARAALVVAAVAPVSLALGLPFPLGLARAGEGGLLPWAWALNGAFSVVATPLANLIALQEGYRWVLLVAVALYGTAAIAFPAPGKKVLWQDIPAT